MMNNNFTDNIALRGSYTHEERAISWSDAVLKIMMTAYSTHICTSRTRAEKILWPTPTKM